MAKKDEQKVEGEAAVVETADSPLLDLTDAAVKRMIKIAKKRGWVTHEELNAVLPSEEISSDQIEDMNSMLNEMGINVVDNEDAEEAEKESGESSEEEESEGGEVAETARPPQRRRPRPPALTARRRRRRRISTTRTIWRIPYRCRRWKPS
jgi:RNA polymerase primary sigma factor